MNQQDARTPAPHNRLIDHHDVDNVVDLLASRASRFPGREFLRFGERSWTYGEIDAWSSRLAHHLRDAEGVELGDRVAIMLPNTVLWPVAWFGVLKAGAVAVPANFAYREADLAFVLHESGAKVVLSVEERLGLVRTVVEAGSPAMDAAPPDLRALNLQALDLSAYDPEPPGVPVGAETLANLQYTSGTTGLPKACVLTHDYWMRLARISRDVTRVSAADTVLTAQPFSYMDPQWNTLMCLIAGAKLVVLPRFSASGFFADVRRHEVTVLYMLGTMPTLLFKQPPGPEDLDNHLRLVLCSGIPANLHAQLQERWGAPWREAYGMTETGVDLVVPLDDPDSVGSGLMGAPVPTKRVRVVDTDGNDVRTGAVGELIVSGKPMMLGYWNRPQETADTIRNGWLHTGDLVQREGSGYFRLVGRLKDMVRRGGENISCAEVEDVLARSDEVVACAVVAVPDELFGEEAKAFVQLAVGTPASRATGERLIDHARAHLARFKVPRYVEFVADFPKTPSERIAKAELKKRASITPGETYDFQEQRS
ncbi:class I adenylate-forming enzyme family protein [Streptomyces sp. NPDC055607]